MCILILNVSFSACCHSNKENTDIVMVGCNKKMTQTDVMAIYLLMCLNLFLHNQCMTIKILDMKVINIIGSSWTQNTLKTSFDGANNLISVVSMNQSKDKNTPDVENIRVRGVKILLIRFGYLKSNDKARVNS